MGYAHYWTARDQEFCPAFLREVRKVIRNHQELVQREDDDPRRPIVTKTEIRFNGVGPEGHETFFMAPGRRDYCKTNQKPYDAVVCQVLLLATYYHQLEYLNSDGFCATDHGTAYNWTRYAIEIGNKLGCKFYLQDSLAPDTGPTVVVNQPPHNTGKWAFDNQRLTDCCGCYSTYAPDHPGVLMCKSCYEEVPRGQGDGNEYARDYDVPEPRLFRRIA